MLNKISDKAITKQFVLVVPIVLATTIIFPTKAYALSLVPPLSELVKASLDQLLLLVVVLLSIFFIISASLAKSKKTKSNSKSKLSQLVLKTLLAIGILFLIFRLSLSLKFIRNLFDGNYHDNLGSFSFPGQIIKTQKIVVGFKKGVSQEKAEEYLRSEKVEFTRTENVNMGKIFFYNTDLKYIIAVSLSETDNRIAKFNSNPLVYDATKYSNNPNELID